MDGDALERPALTPEVEDLALASRLFLGECDFAVVLRCGVSFFAGHVRSVVFGVLGVPFPVMMGGYRCG